MKLLTVFVVLTMSVVSLSSCFNQSKKEPEAFCGVKDPAPMHGNASTIPVPQVFSANCATCHMFDKNGTGPALQHVLKRVPNEAWFDNFVRNEDSLTQVNDPYTLEIQKWSVVRGNHAFSELTDAQLSEIKEYFSQEN